MSVLDAIRYADLLTRWEVKEGLEKGHPLIPGFVLQNRAKQFQQSDAMVQALEQQAGLKPPGQTINDELIAYLKNPEMAQRLQPQELQSPVGPQAMRGMQAPGVGPRPPMPQGGPPGAGGPMPGPQVPGGAGGAMPGMPQGPPGAGGPMMASGGMIPGYQYGSLVEEDRKWWQAPETIIIDGEEVGYEDAIKAGSGILGAVGGGGLTQVGGLVNRLNQLRGLSSKFPGASSLMRRTIGPGYGSKWSALAHPFRTVSGAVGSARLPGGTTSLAELIGRPLARWSTQGGIKGGISNLLTGGPGRFMAAQRGMPAKGVRLQQLKGPFKGSGDSPLKGPLGKADGKGFRAASEGYKPAQTAVGADVFGARAGARGLFGAALAKLKPWNWFDEDESPLADVEPEREGGPGGPGGGVGGAGGGIGGGIAGGRGDYDSWLENEIRAMRTLASTPTPEEEAY